MAFSIMQSFCLLGFYSPIPKERTTSVRLRDGTSLYPLPGSGTIEPYPMISKQADFTCGYSSMTSTISLIGICIAKSSFTTVTLFASYAHGDASYNFSAICIEVAKGIDPRMKVE